MKKLLLLSFILSLSACDEHPNQIVIPPSQQSYIQPSQAPVIIQQESSSHVGSFAAGAALGALAGHVATNISNDKNNQTPIVDNRQNVKPNYMDTSKLSNISKPLTPTSTYTSSSVNLTKTPSKVSKMDMSKLSRK